jgi:hypothetical protein
MKDGESRKIKIPFPEVKRCIKGFLSGDTRKETWVNAANERECSQITLVNAANKRECSQSSCNAVCGDEAMVKAADNCSGRATLRAWKW